MLQNEPQYNAFAFRGKEDLYEEVRELKKRMKELEEMYLKLKQVIDTHIEKD